MASFASLSTLSSPLSLYGQVSTAEVPTLPPGPGEPQYAYECIVPHTVRADSFLPRCSVWLGRYQLL
jgi:hypothetical protein